MKEWAGRARALQTAPLSFPPVPGKRPWIVLWLLPPMVLYIAHQCLLLKARRPHHRAPPVLTEHIFRGNVRWVGLSPPCGVPHKLAVRQEYPKRIWYCVALGIVLFILANFWAKLRRRARRSNLIRKHPSYNRNSIYTGPISLRRLPLAIGSAWDIAAYRWTIPYGRNQVLSLSEFFVTGVYAAGILTWSFINCQSHRRRISGLEPTLIAFFIQPMVGRKTSGPSAQAILLQRKYP